MGRLVDVLLFLPAGLARCLALRNLRWQEHLILRTVLRVARCVSNREVGWVSKWVVCATIRRPSGRGLGLRLAEDRERACVRAAQTSFTFHRPLAHEVPTATGPQPRGLYSG